MEDVKLAKRMAMMLRFMTEWGSDMECCNRVVQHNLRASPISFSREYTI